MRNFRFWIFDFGFIKNSRGLTLVELLIAITIFAILGVGLSSHLRGATVAWRRAVEQTETSQQLRVTADQLERDLVNATLFDGGGQWTPEALFGHQQVQCYTKQPGLHENDPASVRYVAYALDADGALTREILTSQEAHAGSTVREPDVLLRGVASFAVRYAVSEPGQGGASTLSWRDAWEEAGRLPALVEVQLELSGGTSAPRRMHRVIHIPSGTLQRSESSG